MFNIHSLVWLLSEKCAKSVSMQLPWGELLTRTAVFREESMPPWCAQGHQPNTEIEYRRLLLTENWASSQGLWIITFTCPAYECIPVLVFLYPLRFCLPRFFPLPVELGAKRWKLQNAQKDDSWHVMKAVRVLFTARVQQYECTQYTRPWCVCL